jgi:hypothetical protein
MLLGSHVFFHICEVGLTVLAEPLVNWRFEAGMLEVHGITADVKVVFGFNQLLAKDWLLRDIVIEVIKDALTVLFVREK